MPDSARVSVVIPCWRCADTLRRALASVLSQTVAPLEIILVDDGNTDDTPPVLRELASRTPNLVRVVTLQQNVGPGEARNAGWAAARGELIALLDADDAWHPRKLELHLGWLSRQPDAVFSCHKSMLASDRRQPTPVASPCAVERISLLRLLLA